MNDVAGSPSGDSLLADSAAAYLHALRERKGGICQPLCIVVHQFSHTPLYAPVYMALAALKKHCTDSQDSWLRLEYRSTYNDAEALAKVIEQGPRTKSGCLHIGVSEVDANIAPSGLISKTFVKRLPLWGVALTSNPRIRKIKKALTVPQKRFGKIFAGKLSLLRPRDFGTSKGGKPIRFSIYEKGTTAHRLFMDGLPPNSEFSCKLAPDGDDFGLLLSNQVDVALTVQPWRGMHMALQRKIGLEMVYTHMSRPESISSVFMLREPGEHVDLSRHFIDVLGALLQFHVAQLYAGTAMQQAYDSYLDAAGERAIRENLSDFTLAIQLLSDSRVYFHELGDNDGRRRALVQRLRQSMVCQFDVGADRDRVYILSIHAAMVAEKGLDWHRNAPKDRLRDLLVQYKLPGVVLAFESFVEGFTATIGDDDTPQRRKGTWRITDPRELFVCVFKRDSAQEVEYSPWRIWFDGQGRRLDTTQPDWTEYCRDQVEFGPWMHPDITEEVFRHLNAHLPGKGAVAQGTKPFVPRRLRAGVLVTCACVGDGQQVSNYEALSWLWIEYDVGQAEPTRSNNFMRSSTAKVFLNMWRVNHCDAPPVRQVFCRAGHGTCVLGEDGGVYLRAGQQETRIAPCLQSHLGLLFTFRVRGLVS